MDSDNEKSIISWASIVTNKQVTSLKQIQQLSFVQHLLSCIDDTYHWDTCHNFFSLYDKIKVYYEKQLRICIKDIIKNINVYTHPMELWKILLGMALYGKKKQMHITTIMSMDEKMQEQMMSLVTEIIDKLDNLQTIPLDSQPPVSSIIAQDKTIIEQLADENEQYREKIEKIKIKYYELDKSFKNYKEEKQTQLNSLKLREKQFYDEIAYSNIYAMGSTISSPAEVIRDLFATIKKSNRQKKQLYDKYKEAQQKNQQLKKKMEDSVKIIQENAPEKSEIGFLQQQLDKLRKKLTEANERELGLVKRVRQLESQKQNLAIFATYAQKTSREGGITQRDLPKGMDLQIVNKKPNQLSSQYPQKQIHKQKSLNIFPQVKQGKPAIQMQPKNSQQEQNDDGFKATIRHQMDQMRLPAIKMKMQKQIDYLKKENQNLQEQIEQLRNINTLYQDIITKYSEDSEAKFAEYEANMESLKMQLNEGQQQNQQVEAILAKYMAMYHEKQKIYVSKIAQLQMMLKRKKSKVHKHADKIKKKNTKPNKKEQKQQVQSDIKIIIHSEPNQIKQSSNSEIITQPLPQLYGHSFNKMQQQAQTQKQDIVQNQNGIQEKHRDTTEHIETIEPIENTQFTELTQNIQANQQEIPRLPIGQDEANKDSEQYDFVGNINKLSNKIQENYQQQHQQLNFQPQSSQKSSSHRDQSEHQNDMQKLQIAKSKMYYTSELISEGGLFSHQAHYQEEQQQQQVESQLNQKLDQLNRLKSEMKLEAFSEQLSRIANQHDRINEEYNYIIKQCAQLKKEQAANKLAQLSENFDKFSKQIQQNKANLSQIAKSYISSREEETIQLKDNPHYQAMLLKNKRLKQILTQTLISYQQILTNFQTVSLSLNTIHKLDADKILTEIHEKTKQKIISQIAVLGQQNIEIAKLKQQKQFLAGKVSNLEIKIKQYEEEIQIITATLIEFRILAKATNFKNFQELMKSVG